MKSASVILIVLLLLSQCTENEIENVILPKVISTSASQLNTTSTGNRIIEIRGEFRDGQDPVRDIKIALGVNTTVAINPGSLHIHKSVDLLDSNTFKVEFEADRDYNYRVAFYFISENSATYSETFGLYVHNSEVVFVQIYP